ncbi:MAG TPA: hypothetical protein VGW74_05515 [Propionibacteriaceae bacterium]|nr:hypothetical protein [Propionibacteriaceae bacterium]
MCEPTADEATPDPDLSVADPREALHSLFPDLDAGRGRLDRDEPFHVDKAHAQLAAAAEQEDAGDYLEPAPAYLRAVRQAQDLGVSASEHQVRAALAALAMLHPASVLAILQVLTVAPERPRGMCSSCHSTIVAGRCVGCGRRAAVPEG